MCQSNDWCPESAPFRLKDSSCETFDKTCSKYPDQCSELHRACKHCPSNMNISTLKKVLEYVEIQMNRAEMKEVGNSNILQILNMTRTKLECVEPGNGFHIAILIIILIVIIFILLGRKNLRKLWQLCRKKNYTNQRSDHKEERKNLMKNENNSTANPIIMELRDLKGKDENIFSQLARLEQTVNKFYSEFECINKNIQCIQIKFLYDTYAPIRLYVHENQNIVQIKHQLCNKIPHLPVDEYKQIKMKNEKGEDLNDNEYLMRSIDRKNPTVQCYFDRKIKMNDILILKLQGQMQIPDMLQINKNQTFRAVREIIEKIVNSKNLAIFKIQKNNEGSIEMKDGDTFEDGDYLTVVERKEGTVTIKYVLKDNLEINVKYKNTDTVFSLLNSTNNEFILFYKQMNLNQNKFIFEYGIDDGFILNYYTFNNFETSGIKHEDKAIEANNMFQLYNSTDDKGNKILLKKYSIKSYLKDEWKNDDLILNELKAFQITKSYKRFVRLLSTFLSKNEFYVSMEFMNQGTLKSYITLNKELHINLFKWSAQILQGLQFLHKENAIHRDLNPSNIFVHENLDLKLSSSNLSKFDNNYLPCSIIGKSNLPDQKIGKYMAPEIINSENYGTQCDTWSFGIILIRIVTGEEIYPNLSPRDALQKMKTAGRAEYNSACIRTEWKDFESIIDSCVKYDQGQRKTIENLLQIENIKLNLDQ